MDSRLIFADSRGFSIDFRLLSVDVLCFSGHVRRFGGPKAPKEGARRALVAEIHIFATFYWCTGWGRHSARWLRGDREEAAGRPQGGGREAARRL